MKQKYVWAIESGAYSDYGIDGIYSTRKNAKAVFDKLNKNEYGGVRIVRFALDENVDKIKAGFNMFKIRMDYDGTGEASYIEKPSVYDIGRGIDVWQRTKASAYKDKATISDLVIGDVWAKDEQHALKIANEFRAQAIATCRMHKRVNGEMV